MRVPGHAPGRRNWGVRVNISMEKPERALCFVCTATTGVISPWLLGGRRIWEIALIRRELDGTERISHVFIRRADVSMRAVPEEQLKQALDAGRYHERYPEAAGLPMDKVYSGEQAAQIVAAVTRDTYLIGIDPAFHARSFAHLLHTYALWDRVNPPWHRHLVDVRTEVGSALGLPLQRRTFRDLAAALDVDLARYDLHQAVDYATIARDLFDAAFARRGIDPLGRPSPQQAAGVP